MRSPDLADHLLLGRGLEKTKQKAAKSEKAAEHDRPLVVKNALPEEVGVPINSLEAAVGYGSLLREMQHSYIARVAFYRSKEGGALSLDEARARAYPPCKDEAEATRIYNELMSYPLDMMSSGQLSKMWPVAPRFAETLWEMLKGEAGDEFESGHLASKAMTPAQYLRTAWTVASYLGLRESFVEEWQPRPGTSSCSNPWRSSSAKHGNRISTEAKA